MRAFVLAVAALAALAVAIDVPCNGTISDTKNHHSYAFDLSPLHHNDQTYVDSLWFRTVENNIYYVNFCGQTASACDSDDTSVCLRLPDGDDYKYVSAGSTTSQKLSIAEAPNQSPQNSVTVTYSKGDKCGESGVYKTKIYVNCMKDADPGYFYDIDETNDCEATLYMYSSSGCGVDVPYVDPVDPDDSSTDGGEVFATVALVIIFVGAALYFGIGAVYQWKVNQASSAKEYVIHGDFWCAIPGLVKDGAMFIFHGCKKGDYVSV